MENQKKPARDAIGGESWGHIPPGDRYGLQRSCQLQCRGCLQHVVGVRLALRAMRLQKRDMEAALLDAAAWGEEGAIDTSQ